MAPPADVPLSRGLAGTAAVLAHIERNGGVLAAEFLPVLHLARKHVLELRLAHGLHTVGGVDHNGHTVNGEGKGHQPVTVDFTLLQSTAGIADLYKPLANLLHTHAGAAAGHGDADVVVSRHDGLSRLLHDRNVRRAARDVERALLPVEAVQRRGRSQRSAEQNKCQSRKNAFHVYLAGEAARQGIRERTQGTAESPGWNARQDTPCLCA